MTNEERTPMIMQTLSWVTGVQIPTPAGAAMLAEYVAAVFDAIDELPPAQRSVTLLRLQGYKYREIAKMTGSTTRTAENNAHWAKLGLKRNQHILALRNKK